MCPAIGGAEFHRFPLPPSGGIAISVTLKFSRRNREHFRPLAHIVLSARTRAGTKHVPRHNIGKTKSLRKHIPLEIIHQEEYPTRIDAIRRERQIKSYKGGEAFKKLIKNKRIHYL